MKEIVNSEGSDDDMDNLKIDTDENNEMEALSDESEVEGEEEV